MKKINELQVGDYFYAYKIKDLATAGCYQILDESKDYFKCCLLNEKGDGVIGSGVRVYKKAFELCDKSSFRCCMFSVFVPSHFYGQGCKSGMDNVYPMDYRIFADKMDFMSNYESVYMVNLDNLENTLNKVKNL